MLVSAARSSRPFICTHRGAPGVKDEPRHELMGRITGRMFDTMKRLQEK
ncbi:MAG: hypothetical protein ACREX9_15565 [Gammaproteobacteria bacterium]